MAKKEKIKKVKPEKVKDKDVNKEENKEPKDPNQEEVSDKISIKKNFRDTFIVLGALVVVLGLVFYINKDSFFKGLQGEIHEEVEPEVEVDPTEGFTTDQKVVYYLKALANKGLLENKYDLDNKLNYIGNISSLQYSDDKVTYIAIADQENLQYVVKVELVYSFNSVEKFITEMSNLKVANTSATTTVYNLVSDENIDANFVARAPTLFSNFDADRAHRHVLYRDSSDSTRTYVSTTFLGNDDVIYSMNEVIYDNMAAEFGATDPGYHIDSEENAMLYSILNSFAA